MNGNKTKTGVIIQERDRRMLGELAEMRIIDRELAKIVAPFTSTTRANARLLKLTRAGLLNRFFSGTISGGRRSIYTLAAKGSALMHTEHRGISRSHGKTLVGDLFIDHQMFVNQVYVAVKHQPLPDGVYFQRWRSFHHPLTASSRLVPDGYIELATPAGVRAMFLEVDLGNQTARVWEQKTRAYLHFAISGQFSHLFHQPQFRVLVIAVSRRRLENIRAVIAKQTDKIFWLSDFQTINLTDFWSAHWVRPTGNQTVPFV